MTSNKKLESNETKNMIHDASILFFITLIAGVILGFVFQITKEPISIQKQKAIENACKEIFQDAASFKTYDAISIEEADEFFLTNGYTAQKLNDVIRCAYNESDELLGYVLTMNTSEGYGGDISFTMGIRLDGTLNGISILTISETPGLGMRAEEVLKPQFMNKNVEKFEYTKSGAAGSNQIDAISGATITTEAITNGVNAGLDLFSQVLKVKEDTQHE